MPEKLFFAVSAFSLDTLLLCSRQNFPLYFVMGSFPPATALHFQNFSKSYILHSLQVAIRNGKLLLQPYFEKKIVKWTAIATLLLDFGLLPWSKSAVIHKLQVAMAPQCYVFHLLQVDIAMK